MDFPQAFAQDSSDLQVDFPVKSLSQNDYTISKVTSIILGFGIGHAIQGRWLDKGWIFTTGNILTTGGFLFSLFGAGYASMYDDEQTAEIGMVSSIVFFILTISLKTYEAIDVWKAPGYEIKKSSALELKPIISMNALKGSDFGLSLKYSF